MAKGKGKGKGRGATDEGLGADGGGDGAGGAGAGAGPLRPRSGDPVHPVAGAWTAPSGAVEEDEAEFVDAVADCLSVGLPLDVAAASWASGRLESRADDEGTMTRASRVRSAQDAHRRQTRPVFAHPYRLLQKNAARARRIGTVT